MIQAALIVFMWFVLMYVAVAVIVVAYHIVEEAIEHLKDHIWKKKHSKQ